MKNTTSFTLYDAAAGSGKTFTLVKEYLKIILQAKSDGYYKYILAITFTNKAVAEMKQRIINNLISFSQDNSISNPSVMAIQIAKETDLTFEKINDKSKKVLKHILHHYSSFNVETIDSFNHRLIRTFARDLELSGNFEVSLDIPKIQAEAVDQLILKAGGDPKITQILLDFALEKIDDDKSWDISKDIIKTSGLLFNENDSLHIKKLQEKSLDDFINFRKMLLKKRTFFEKEIITIAKDTLQLINEAGIEYSDFSSSYLPKHFEKLANGKFDLNFNAKWQEALGDKPLYPSRVKKDTPEVVITIESLEPIFISNFKKSKSLAFQELFIKSLLKNINPLSVINLVSQEIDDIKVEQNILPISEFNHLINNEIKSQPTPFIYERLGERYRHFFIDEFQDTSYLQWHNMIPLIDNALSQQFQDGNTGSLLLVGDAKQSIYRWRGGLPEQFIGLCNNENPFQSKKELLHLPTNFRSCKEIVDFNNEFFTFTSNFFGDAHHKNIYVSGNQQNSNTKEGGYVKFDFIETKNKEESHLVYANKVLQTIQELFEKGYQEKDICILTRKRKDGITLGTFLLENGITIISSETLLLEHSLVVKFLLNCLTISIFPENDEARINFLEFLHKHLSVSEDKHSFFNSLVKTSLKDFSSYFEKYHIDFSFRKIQSLSLYDSFEYCIRKFKLEETADAYLFGLMDMVYEFEMQPKASKLTFLEEWELKKEKAGISVSDSTNGIQLMTIHKAKGLEFPIVLFPYADLNIYTELEPKSWFELNKDEFGFEESLVNFNNNIQEFGEQGKEIYQKRRNTLELDNINLLYVTLTRAEVQLYIYTELPTSFSVDNPTSYHQFFSAFLKHKGLWEEGKNSYEIGTSQSILSNNDIEVKPIYPTFISSSPKNHNLNIISKDALLWDTEKEKAIFSGNQLHNVMEGIKYEQDMASVLEDLEKNTEFTQEEIFSLKEMVVAIVSHPDLNRYYKTRDTIFNEQKIITSIGNILIPDRLNFHQDKSVTIIDYKTGIPIEKHEHQLESYAFAIKEMGYLVSEKILIYSSSEGIVINKV